MNTLSAEDQQFAADAMTELDRAVRLHRLKRAGRLFSSAAAVSESSTAIGTGRLQTGSVSTSSESDGNRLRRVSAVAIPPKIFCDPI